MWGHDVRGLSIPPFEGIIWSRSFVAVSLTLCCSTATLIIRSEKASCACGLVRNRKSAAAR